MRSFLFLLFVLCNSYLYSQSYFDGDIRVDLNSSGYHDSITCSAIGFLDYDITIQNSFKGDSVKIVSNSGGKTWFSDYNSLGQNPWRIKTKDLITMNKFDCDIVNNIAQLNHLSYKVISGNDTVRDIKNELKLNLKNICQCDSVTGKVFVDYNNDCLFNGNDAPVSGASVLLSEHLTNDKIIGVGGLQYTNKAGNYGFNALRTYMTKYQVYIPPYYQFIFPPHACSINSFEYTTLPKRKVDFVVKCNDSTDLQCKLSAPVASRPKTPFALSVSLANTGCTPAKGDLVLILNKSVKYDPISSVNPPQFVRGDTLIWPYQNLSNLTAGAYWNSFQASIHLTPNQNLNIGDSLCFRLYTQVGNKEINILNNSDRLCVPIKNSYDPNIKEVSPRGFGVQGFIPQKSDELTYTIHFQNTGNAEAINITIIDTLEENIIPEDLKIISATHRFTPRWLSDRIIAFDFENINLPDSTSNEPQSHGSITFKTGIKNDLTPGSEIKNKAAIYFDFNPPIITNTAISTIELNVATVNENEKKQFVAYPNPTNSLLNILIRTPQTENIIAELYNSLGHKVYHKVFNNTNLVASQIELLNLSSGYYFLNVRGNNWKESKLIIKAEN